MICLQTVNSKVLYFFLGLLLCTDNKNEPVANIIDGNVQLYVLSHIPDYKLSRFYRVAEWVFDQIPESSRVMTLLQTYSKKTKLNALSANSVEHRNTFDLRPEDLSTKTLERLPSKWFREKTAYHISFKSLADILMHAERE